MTATRVPKALVLPVLATLVLAACAGGEIGATEEPAASEPAATGAEPTEMAFPEGDVAIELWTKEGDPQIEFVQALADDFTAMHPNVTFDVINKDVELLREDMVNTALSPEAQPELLWTVSDHTGPLTAAGVIQAVDNLVDTSQYVEAALLGVQAEDQTWGVPISLGNQLMLYWNKSIVGEEPPADTAELISVAQEHTDAAAGTYGLVFNETESFWLTPWIGGFGGEVFAEDGVTPTLDTDAMRGALQFLYGLKYTEQVMPQSTDYDTAHALFQDGAAAMIVNGDWVLADYTDTLGEDLGVGPLPTVTDTGEDPKPYTAGTYFMVPSALEGDALIVVTEFMKWVTAPEQQLLQLEELSRLPANAEAAADPAIQEDPLLAGSFAAVEKGIPQPGNVEMRCVFDQMNLAIRDVLGAGNSDIAAVTATLQANTETCIAQQA